MCGRREGGREGEGEEGGGVGKRVVLDLTMTL